MFLRAEIIWICSAIGGLGVLGYFNQKATRGDIGGPRVLDILSNPKGLMCPGIFFTGRLE